MISYVFIISSIWLLGLFALAGAIPWVHPSLEVLDELNDAEIFKSVVSSLNDFHRRHNNKKLNARAKREDTSVCYPELGCFEASGPFGYLDMLPAKPEEINTKFLLYPGRNRRRSGSPPAEVPFTNLKDAFEWAKQGFNKSLPTKVLIHGFGSDCGYIWIYEMRSALMAVEEVNVICVDWQNGATLPNYVRATANTRLVGKQLAMLLRGLVEHNGLSLRNTHLIGFSLGAHIAGFAGADLGNLSRITGLDPAGPLFESQDTRARLDQTDAAFVDVIHSNGENLILGGLGTSQPMGHVDFYPNGGRMQKGCSHLFVGAVSDIIWSSAVEGRSLCNHRRAYKFFIDSVSPRCHFPAFPCESYEDFLDGKCFPCTEERKCGNMGYYADRSKGRGQLYLITRDEEPFCAHQYHVKIETSPSQIPIKSYGKIQITLIGDSFLNETFMLTRKEDEEMNLGDSISRMLVPHPILSQPTRIQIIYTAYSGWLSSGLTQWRIDKVTLMDSFGKTSSVCKKNLILDSGVPVTLPLYPGQCNIPKDTSTQEAQDRIHNSEVNEQKLIKNNSSLIKEENNYIPTQVIRVGMEGIDKNLKEINKKPPISLTDAMDILNISWKSDKENKLVDNEAESSRAFNTKIAQNLNSETGAIKEIVEPVLKPHSSKNGRSHDLNKKIPEITEPILGPTTSKNFGSFNVESIVKNDYLSKLTNNNKEITYNFYESSEHSDWVPSNPTKTSQENKWKREDEPKLFPNLDLSQQDENPFEVIATTVQFLPQRLAKMFEQAEKYARETILPLVSTYTPKFITDIIAPKEKPKYVPLNYEATVSAEVSTTSETPKLNSSNETESRSLKRKNFNPPPISNEQITTTSTTPYTHIQKIRKKSDHLDPLSLLQSSNFSVFSSIEGNNETKSNDDSNKVINASSVIENLVTSRKIDSNSKGIYIDLPVFEDKDKAIKYIPLSFPKSDKSETKKT